MIDSKPQIKGAQRISIRFNNNKKTNKNGWVFIFKLHKIKDKKKILKTAREKKIYYTEKSTKRHRSSDLFLRNSMTNYMSIRYPFKYKDVDSF